MRFGAGPVPGCLGGEARQGGLGLRMGRIVAPHNMNNEQYKKDNKHKKNNEHNKEQ
jgi:hypothetical protein